MAKTSRRPKKLTYALIGRATEVGRPIYDLLDALVVEHHPELREARIAIAWNLSWQPDADGRVTLGKCKRASELDRELAPFDFVILLRREFWTDFRVTALQRRALLDHELTHAAVSHDADGEPKVDATGRVVYRLRRHDLEEFADIASRYGCYKRDLESFAQALDQARARASHWVGYTSVRERLIAAGVTIPLETIIGWTEEERREAVIWAGTYLELQRRGAGVFAEDLPLPATVAACTRGESDGEMVVGEVAAS